MAVPSFQLWIESKMSEKETKEPSFEKAYTRLEEILQKMQSGAVSLEESLKLYEEADMLIQSCGKKISEAELKIEVLMKNREGDVVLNESGRPITQPFATETRSSIS